MEIQGHSFAPLTEEIFDSTEFASAWNIENWKTLRTRKYGQDDFSPIFACVYDWVGKNRDRLRGLSLEEQEKIMIAEGVITRDDI